MRALQVSPLPILSLSPHCHSKFELVTRLLQYEAILRLAVLASRFTIEPIER